MDSYMARPRYVPRRPAAVQKHRRTPRPKGRLGRLIVLQTVICIVLLLLIIIIKGIHISATDYISQQVDYVLGYNVELESIFNYVEKLAADIRSSIAPGPADKAGNDGLMAAEETKGNGSAVTEASTGAGNSGDTGAAADSGASAVEGNLRQDTADTSTKLASGTDEAAVGADYASTADTDAHIGAVLPENTADTYENTSDSSDGTAYDGDNSIGDSSSHPQTSVLAASSGGSEQELPEMTAPAHGAIATPFGRISGGNANVNFHNGIDIALKPGNSVVAAADGEVAEVGISREYGAFIRIVHKDGWQTVYAGCSSYTAQKGTKINRGDVLAKVGNSAIPVGYHLHFELWKDGKPVDPLEYISVGSD